MTLQQKLNAAAAKAIKDYDEFRALQYRRVLDVLSIAADQLQNKIIKAERAGVISPAREVILLQQVKDEILKLAPSLTGKNKGALLSVINQGSNQAIDIGIKSGIKAAQAAGIDKYFKVHIGTSFTGRAGEVIRYNAATETYADSVWAKLHADAATKVKAWTPGGQTLSDRVWSMTWEAQKAISDQVKAGIITGRSAANISRDVRSYLIDPTLRRGKALKDFHPGRGVYKSASKNALRLTRTEISRSFHEGTIAYQKRMTWSDGFEWHTSPINCCDECQPLDGKFFIPEDLPDLPVHPNCMCWTTPHIKPEVAARFT